MNARTGRNIEDDGTCSLCGHPVTDADASVVNVISAKNDPEGKCKIEVRLECSTCGTDLRAFVAEDLFVDIDTYDDGVLL